jgi:transposase-like protein
VGDTIDFMLSGHLDEDAATAFFEQAINANGMPKKWIKAVPSRPGWRI